MTKRISWAVALIFIVSCSGETEVVRQYPQMNTVGYQVLKDNCAQCHGAPLPASRAAHLWPAIVYRMQQHRLKKAYDPIDKVKLQHLISYLQRNAKKDP